MTRDAPTFHSPREIERLRALCGLSLAWRARELLQSQVLNFSLAPIRTGTGLAEQFYSLGDCTSTKERWCVTLPAAAPYEISPSGPQTRRSFAELIRGLDLNNPFRLRLTHVHANHDLCYIRE